MVDLNDNKPVFIYPKRTERFAKQAYYGAVATDAIISSPVIQVKVRKSLIQTEASFGFNLMSVNSIVRRLSTTIAINLLKSSIVSSKMIQKQPIISPSTPIPA